jgi:ribonucleotide reductase alpha subunit
MKGKWWQKLSEAQKENYRRMMSQAVSGKGNGMYGKHHKNSSKELIGQRRKEYFADPENRERLSRTISRLYQLHPEIKEKISQANTFLPLLVGQCPNCGKETRYKAYCEKKFCSRSCSSIYVNKHRDTINVKETKARRREQLRAELYELGVRFWQDNQKLPTYQEFRQFAQRNGFSGDVRSTFGGFINFAEQLTLHNHKVVSVEFYGYEDVYNITVDDFHTVAYITSTVKTTKLTKKPLLSGIITSNCGEIPLYEGESCNLGSINVWSFCKTSPTNGRKKAVEFDWEGLRQTVAIATRFLDNVVDVNKYPLPEIEEITLKTRKIGLGIMGLGDLLFELEIPYNSSEGLEFIEQLMEFINYHSKLASIELARQRGKFPYYRKSFYSEGHLPISGPEDKSRCYLDWDSLREKIKQHGLRHSQTTTNAPTGSISMIAGASSGIEPVFSLVFEKEVAIGSFYYVDPVFEKSMEREGLFDDALIKEVSDRGGTLQGLSYVPPRLKKIFATAMDIDAKDHIKALASLQKWTDSSISKTINFPSSATVEDMKTAYLLAYRLGCKGVTVFRDKSIKGVMNTEIKKDKDNKSLDKEKRAKDGEVEMISLKDDKAKGPGIYLEPGVAMSGLGFGESLQSDLCPKCKIILVKSEGCKKCPQCGWGLCAG